MQNLTDVWMEDFSKYLGIHRTFSLMCYMFWILSPAEGNVISKVVGSSVSLHCSNDSISTLSLLTWKMNNISLFSFTAEGDFYIHPEALSLNINMSKSESQLYALVIETAQKSHAGNYTCEINTATGVWEQKWELMITEREKSVNWEKLVIHSVCGLIIIIILIILQRICKQRAKNRIHSPTQEQTEEIYENCLETDGSTQRGYYHFNNYQPRAH